MIWFFYLFFQISEIVKLNVNQMDQLYGSKRSRLRGSFFLTDVHRRLRNARYSLILVFLILIWIFLYFHKVSHIREKAIMNVVHSMESVAQRKFSTVIGSYQNYQKCSQHCKNHTFVLYIVTFQSILLISFE